MKPKSRNLLLVKLFKGLSCRITPVGEVGGTVYSLPQLPAAEALLNQLVGDAIEIRA
jgi:hypothetical protein